MATSSSQNDQLAKIVQTLLERHRKLEAKHEALERKVSVLQQQITATDHFRRQNINPANTSSTTHDSFEPVGASNYSHNGNVNSSTQTQSRPIQPGARSLQVNTNTVTSESTRSPVRLNTQPPSNVQRPLPGQPGIIKPVRFADICTSEKPRRHFYQSVKPEQDEVANVLRKCGVDVNGDSVAAVMSSTVQGERDIELLRLAGLHTVLVLDTSESMTGQKFDIMKKVVTELLVGMDATERECGLYEYVSVITCGGATQVVQNFTNNYTDVKNKIDGLKLGGRTPMLTALTLALSCIELQGETVIMNAYKVQPRVIIISDFDMTTDTAPFMAADGSRAEERIQLQSEAFTFGRTQFKPLKYHMTAVPVYQNIPVAKEFANCCNGTVITNNADIQKAKYFYRYQIAAGYTITECDRCMERGIERDVKTVIKESLSMLKLDDSHEAEVERIVDEQMENTNDFDIGDIENDATLSQSQSSLLESPYVQGSQSQGFQQVQVSVPELPEWNLTRHLDNISLEEKFGVPAIGTRVRRGRDWKSNNEDNYGPGTIVGHKDRGVAYVVWDTEQFGEYVYDKGGVFEIQTADDIRRVDDGHIEIGCHVVRGSDWCRGDEDGGIGTVGVVVRKLRGRFVQVRWPSGVVETYRFGAENKWDIQISDETSGHRNASSRNTTRYVTSPLVGQSSRGNIPSGYSAQTTAVPTSQPPQTVAFTSESTTQTGIPQSAHLPLSVTKQPGYSSQIGSYQAGSALPENSSQTGNVPLAYGSRTVYQHSGYSPQTGNLSQSYGSLPPQTGNQQPRFAPNTGIQSSSNGSQTVTQQSIYSSYSGPYGSQSEEQSRYSPQAGPGIRRPGYVGPATTSSSLGFGPAQTGTSSQGFSVQTESQTPGLGTAPLGFSSQTGTLTAGYTPDRGTEQGQSNVPLKPWWSWRDNEDQWRPFLDENVDKLEQKHQAGQPNCLIQYKNKSVKVFLNDFKCEIDGRQYTIKRETLKQEDIDSLKSVDEYLPPLS